MFTKKPPNVRIGTQRVGGQNAAIPSGAKTATILRNDLHCGIKGCAKCAALERNIDAGASVPTIDPAAPIMIPDSHTLLLYTNLFDDPTLDNIVLLSSVLAEVQKKNRMIYQQIQQRLIANKNKRVFVFSNNNHADTACTRKADEAEEVFDARCLQVAVGWYSRYFAELKKQMGTGDLKETSESNQEPDVYLVTTTETRKTELSSTQANVSYRTETLRDFIGNVLADAESSLLERVHTVSDVLPQGPGAGTGGKGTEGFFEHWPESQYMPALDTGALIKGKLKVSDTSCFFGEIRGRWNATMGSGANAPQIASLPPNCDRVLIAGKFAMNRAISDDQVVVQILPLDQWRAPAGIKVSSPPTSVEEAVDAKYSPTGRVVGILQMKRRPYCGSIQVDDLKKFEGVSGSVSVLVQPKSNKIPKIRIQTRQLEELKDKRLSVVIDEWPVTSSSPLGHYVDVLGRIGDKETEAKVILIENDIPHYDFSQAVYDCLPKGNWNVEAAEEQVRLDIRHITVCSVDPLGCRDIDDALHWRRLENGDVEVGVHIADVTHFLKEYTPMDEEAQKRSTSVYLVDRRINMLPQLLTENLCSIVGNEDRYAFSIIWVFEKDSLKIKKEYFGKTIIRSRAALYYGDAQRMIDDPSDTTDIALSLKGLMDISRKLKKARMEAGALFLASQEFKFKTDDEHLNPTDMTKYQTFEANSMVEEWMLYANVAAARKIHEVFPKWALLRRHQPPDESSFSVINEAIERKLKIRLDASSSLALNRSLDACVDPSDPFFNELVRMLTTRCLRQAQYFSSGEVPYEEFQHYGLAMPIYTHFTSPIRRYSDVIVHRQLAATLKILEVSDQHTNVERINAIAENLNYRHEQAQKAGRDSKNLFTGFYLRNFPDGNVPPEPGYIIKITDTHVFVLVPKYGQENKIEREDISDVESLNVLDRVQVGIQFKQDGDVMRTKLVFSILKNHFPVAQTTGSTVGQDTSSTKADEGLINMVEQQAMGAKARNKEAGEDMSAADDERQSKRPRKE